MDFLNVIMRKCDFLTMLEDSADSVCGISHSSLQQYVVLSVSGTSDLIALGRRFPWPWSVDA